MNPLPFMFRFCNLSIGHLSLAIITLLFLSMTCVIPVKCQELDFEYLKIVNDHGQPIIEGSLNGRKAYFLLDSGSPYSILHELDAKAYRFKYLKRYNQNYHIYSFNSRVEKLWNVHEASIRLGSTKIIIPLVCYNMNHIVKAFQRKTSYRINGILGADVMNQYSFLIDFSSRNVVVVGKRHKRKGQDVQITLSRVNREKPQSDKSERSSY